MATGIRCPRCEVLNRDDVQACRACGAPLPVVVRPAPAPATPPRILRPTQPAPLMPPSLSNLPPARAPAPAAPPPSAPPPRAALPGPQGAPTADVAVAPPPAPAARRTPTARAPTPPPQRPASSARPAAVIARPTPTAAPAASAAAPRVTVAPFARALLATLVDGLVVGGLAFAVTALLAPALAGDAAPKTQGLFGALELVLAAPVVIAAFAAVALLSSTVLNAALLPFTGATVGGLAAGVRLVVRSSGARPTVPRAALRGLTSALGGLLLLVGPLWAVWLDPLRRGLGDVVSGTLPVKRSGST